jgi:hypothetical protein
MGDFPCRPSFYSKEFWLGVAIAIALVVISKLVGWL